MRILLAIAAAIPLCGCATATTGTQQQISFAVAPDGAQCEVRQTGSVLGRVSGRDTKLAVPKSRFPLVLACVASRSEPFEVEVQPRGSGTAMAGAALSLTSAIVDSASGALYEYPPSILIDVARQKVEVPAGFETGPKPQ